MDHLLPPTELEVQSEEAEPIFNYWLRTFRILKAVTATSEDAETVSKLGLLQTFLLIESLRLILMLLHTLKFKQRSTMDTVKEKTIYLLVTCPCPEIKALMSPYLSTCSFLVNLLETVTFKMYKCCNLSK